MTPEQKKHEEEYNASQRKYQEALDQSTRAQNQIIQIQNRRKQIVREINQLKAEKKRYEDSAETITRAGSRESDINQSLSQEASALEAASEGFSSIGDSSNVSTLNLKSIFSEEDAAVRKNISSVFNDLQSAKTKLETKITDLENQIRRLESEKADGEAKERQLKYSVSENNRKMNNASFEMAYHKTQMTLAL